jgi:hypothetical protein
MKLISLGCGLDDRGSRVRFPAGTRNFSLHHRVQNGSEVHSASYPMGTRRSFSGVNRLEREANHSPQSGAEVKEWVELYLHSPNTPSWRGAQLKHRDSFTFYHSSVSDMELCLHALSKPSALPVKHRVIFIFLHFTFEIQWTIHRKLGWEMRTLFGLTSSDAFIHKNRKLEPNGHSGSCPLRRGHDLFTINTTVEHSEPCNRMSVMRLKGNNTCCEVAWLPGA